MNHYWPVTVNSLSRTGFFIFVLVPVKTRLTLGVSHTFVAILSQHLHYAMDVLINDLGWLLPILCHPLLLYCIP